VIKISKYLRQITFMNLHGNSRTSIAYLGISAPVYSPSK